MYVFLYVYMSVCVCVCICIYVCMYVCACPAAAVRLAASGVSLFWYQWFVEVYICTPLTHPLETLDLSCKQSSR